MRIAILVVLVVEAAVGPAPGADKPAPVAGFVAPAADEHPRLFFRKGDLPELKRRAETPEGKAIVERLKFLLGGCDAVPTKRIRGHQGRTEMDGWTLYHAMGYGFLYHLTGEKKYIDMSKEAMDLAYSGQADEQARAYSWKRPESYLRGGPSLAAVAMAYDMCFDVWPPEYRQKLARDILNYDVQGGAYRITMKQMVEGGNHKPGSNHHGSALGGAGLCMLAIRGDTGVDQKLVEQYLQTVEQKIQELFQEGMGDSGWFWEGPGPGQIASDTCLVPMLQAFRVAAGKDYAAGMPGPKALIERWVAWLMLRPETKQPVYANTETSWSMGGYGGRTFGRYGVSRGGQFSQGFGLLTRPEEKAAVLWTYKNVVEPSEQDDYKEYSLGGKPSYDAINLPHRAVLSFVNWPIGIEPKNPEGIIAKTRGDRTEMGYYYFRKGWKDENDVFVGVQTGSRTSGGGGKGRAKGKGGGAGAAEDIAVWGLGERHAFGAIERPGVADFYQGYADGSGLVTSGQTAVAVDYGKASGADAVVVVAGPAAKTYRATKKVDKSRFTAMELGGRPWGVLVFSASGKFSAPQVAGNQLTVGGQTFAFDGKNLRMEKTAPK